MQQLYKILPHCALKLTQAVMYVGQFSLSIAYFTRRYKKIRILMLISHSSIQSDRVKTVMGARNANLICLCFVSLPVSSILGKWL